MTNVKTGEIPFFAPSGILGCKVIENSDDIFCLNANDDNNFLNFGIVENSILIIDKSKEYKENSLNVYKFKCGACDYKLSRTVINGEFCGRVIMTINHYE